MAAQRTYRIIPLAAILPTVGTWARAVASNIVTLDKSAADNTSVLYVPVHDAIQEESSHARERLVKSIRIQYSVATADLDAAPTYVLSKTTMSTTTGARTRATVSQSAAVVGTDTTGLAQGTFIATITPTTPVRIENNEELWLEVTINAAATSVVKIGRVDAQIIGN